MNLQLALKADDRVNPGPEMRCEGIEDRWTLCLVEMAAQQDRERFLQLYEHFAPRLKNYLCGQGSDPAQAEELSQEAMLAVWRKARQFRPERASAGTWIFRIGRNLWIDRLRRGAETPVDAVRDEADEHAPAPEALADHGPLREALRQLPLLQAQTVYKSYFLGQSHSEIAAELQIPLGSVKSNLRLAFRSLRRSLGVNS